MKDDDRTVADVIDDVAKGRIGHREAMDQLGLESYPALVETMHANGRTLWAHRPRTRIDKATLDVLRLACKRATDLGPTRERDRCRGT